MAGYSVLGPTLTPEQHLAQKLVDMDQRITMLEALPSVAFTDYDPTTETPVPGTRHVNMAQNRVWVYTGTKWITTDSAHAYGEALSTPTTGSSSVSVLSPSVSVRVQDTGVVLVHMQAWVQHASANGAQTWLVEDNTAVVRVHRNIVTGAWEERGSVPGGTAGGAPRQGGWLAFATTPGQHTYSYGLSSPSGGTAMLDRRSIYVVTL